MRCAKKPNGYGGSMLLVMVKLDHDAHNSRKLSVAELVRRAERAALVIESVHERRSASGRGWHRVVYVRADTLAASQIVGLQLLFGSDPLREAYNWNRARAIDGGEVSDYWKEQNAWDVLYRSRHPWRRVETKMLAAHRERNGNARPTTTRDKRKG